MIQSFFVRFWSPPPGIWSLLSAWRRLWWIFQSKGGQCCERWRGEVRVPSWSRKRKSSNQSQCLPHSELYVFCTGICTDLVNEHFYLSVPPKYIEILNHLSGSKIEIKENEEVEIACKVSNAKPKARIFWYRNNVAFNPGLGE